LKLIQKPMAPKRINKTKDEIAKEMAHKQMVKQQKVQAAVIFKCLEGVDSIYDAQTVVNALSGFIKYELSVKEASLKVNDLLIDMKNEPDSKIKEAIEKLKVELQDKNAKDISLLLQRFGDTLGHFSANKFMKNPMSEIKIEDIIAK